MSIPFTGERFVPGQSLPNMEADHFRRYEFAANFVAGKRVVDIACGTGYGSAVLADAGAASVLGVDCSAEAIDHAKARYKAGNLAFRQDDILEFEPRQRFDLVVSFETIEHIDDHRGALAKFFDILQPGGRLIISSPNRLITSPKAKNQAESGGGFHVMEFTIEELRKELECAGFEVGDEVYGQRQQVYLPTAFLRKLYDIVCKPKKRANPLVDRVTTRMPRYFVIVAEKR